MRSFFKSHSLWFFILFLVTLPLIVPLFFPGVIKTDDGDWMIIRFSAFYEAFRDGQIPVRWLSRLNNGMGYPVTNFLYPGYLYISTPFFIVTRSYITAVEMLIASSLLFSAWGMYLWTRNFFTPLVSGLSAIFYLYAPYHIYDYFKRGSVGELLSLSIVPFTFYFIARKHFLGTALSIALLILAHNTLAVLFLPVIFIYIFILYGKHKNNLKEILISGVLGIGIAAFFWLPALYDLKDTVFSTKQVSNWREYLTPLHLIGIPTILISFAGLISVLRKKTDKHTWQVIFFLIIVFCGIMLSLPFPMFIWEFLPVAFIQFPFRLMSVVLVGSSFVFAWVIQQFGKVTQVGILLLCLTISILLGSKYYSVELEKFKDDNYFSTNQATTTVQNEYLPINAKDTGKNLVDGAIIENGRIENFVKESNNISFEVMAHNKSEVTVGQLFFPGWKSFINNREQKIGVTDEGFMKISVPSGTSQITFSFSETPLRLFSDTISLVSFVILISFSLIRFKSK